MICRFCHTPLNHKILDLGITPLANGYLLADDLHEQEPMYPLQLYRCTSCQLVQLNFEAAPQSIFNKDYAFLSSSSDTWKEHCKQYATEIKNRFGGKDAKLIIEIGVNDGTLLENLLPLSEKVLGIDPAESTTRIAVEKGLPVITNFFTNQLANSLLQDGFSADLIVANNVLAHVPDINDFVHGIATLLSSDGMVTIEFPYLPNVISDCQFDTVYHEHFFYFSLTAVQRIMAKYNLEIFDVKPLDIHGGSIRIYLKKDTNKKLSITPAVGKMIQAEEAIGITGKEYYSGLQKRAEEIRDEFRHWLTEVKLKGKKVMAYGAAAKGNTFLNFSNTTVTDIPCIADVTIQKQGKLLPGSHIPIVAPEQIEIMKPDYIVALPWNYKKEINQRLSYTKDWGCRIVYFIPSFEIY